MRELIHPTDMEWEKAAKATFRESYQDLVKIFREILGRAFLKCHWIPDPLALDYMTKILIRFLPITVKEEGIESALLHCELERENQEKMIRFYECAGELILWLSGLYGKSIFQAEGKRSFAIAYEQLMEYESGNQIQGIIIPGKEAELKSKRLRVNKMFSEQFENYQEILEKSNIIEDPAYAKYRTHFMTDDFSIN